MKAKMGKTIKTRDSQKWKVFKPDKQVSVKVPIAERNTRWELKIEPHQAQLAPPPVPEEPNPRRRIREGWVTRRPAPREETPSRLQGTSRELKKLAPHMKSRDSNCEDPLKFQAAKASLRSVRARQ